MPSNCEAGIKDVARHAGVSVGTVSNVLNRPDVVSDGRREAVEAAIRELGYVPNRAARQLKVGESGTIGFITMNVANPFYGELLSGAEKRAEAEGLTIMLASSHADLDRQNRHLHTFEQNRVRGLLITPVGRDYSVLLGVQQRGTPVVLLDAEPDKHFCTMATNDAEGGRLAAAHLINLGKTRLAVVGQGGDMPQVQRRLKGAQAAAAANHGVRIEFMGTAAMSILEGRRVGQAIAARLPANRPEAIFATNDLLAIGVLQALTMTRRIRVPDDIEIIGFDDIDFCASAVVPLSSVRQPGQALGAAAIELLDAERHEGSGHRHVQRLLRPEVVARESSSR